MLLRLLLAAFPIPCASHAYHLWVGARAASHGIAAVAPNTVETVPSLAAGVERAGALLAGSPISHGHRSGASDVVIHLDAGRHQLLRPLSFTARHSRISFVGHGSPAQPSIISGGVPALLILIVTADWLCIGILYCFDCCSNGSDFDCDR